MDWFLYDMDLRHERFGKLLEKFLKSLVNNVSGLRLFEEIHPL